MNILCFGDSNTYGYNPADGMRYPETVRWTGLLQELLPRDRIIEEGCNGRTASVTPEDEPWKDGRTYLKACLNSHKPLDLVVLMLGSNDLKWMFHASPEHITAGIREILDTIQAFTAEKQGFCPAVLLVGPPQIGEGITSSPFSDSFEADAVERSKALGALYRAEADRINQAGQMRCAFLNAANLIQPSKTDSLHLDPGAHRDLADAICAKINDLR